MWDYLLRSPECETGRWGAPAPGTREARLSARQSRQTVRPSLLRWCLRPDLLLPLHAPHSLPLAVCTHSRSPLTSAPPPPSLHPSLSLYPPARPLWVSGSQRKSLAFLEARHWLWYDGSGNKSIVRTSIEYLHPFTNQFWQGIHIQSRRGGCGVALAPLMKQLGAGDRHATLHLPRVRAPPPPSPPLSPETTPVALCWQLTGCSGRAWPTSGNPPRTKRDVDALAKV